MTERQPSPAGFDALIAAIVKYLDDNPTATDTAEGIRNWWLRGSNASADDVAVALERLVRAGQIQKVESQQRTVYRRRARSDA
jgi:hypothetical protein